MSTSAVKIRCPHCGRTGTSSKRPAVGMKIHCPGCQHVFAYASEEPVPETIDLVKPPPRPARPPAPTLVEAPKPVVLRPEVIPPPIPVAAAVPAQVVNVNIQEPRRGNALAIASLVLGILAILGSWIPVLGMLAIPVAALGFILGVIGLVLALAAGRSGLAASSVGTGLSVLALVVVFVITGSFVQAVSNASKKSGNARVAQSDTPASKPLAKQPITPADTWVMAPAPAVLGDVRVRLSVMRVGKVPLKGPTGASESQNSLLMILVEITNRNEDRKLSYATWTRDSVALTRDLATLQDDLGNHYRHIDFGIFDKPLGRTNDGSLYPDRPINDLLVFEEPLTRAKHLDLVLPGENVGAAGRFQFRIPAELIER